MLEQSAVVGVHALELNKQPFLAVQVGVSHKTHLTGPYTKNTAWARVFVRDTLCMAKLLNLNFLGEFVGEHAHVGVAPLAEGASIHAAAVRHEHLGSCFIHRVVDHVKTRNRIAPNANVPCYIQLLVRLFGKRS